MVFGLIYRRYLGILGADRRRPAERQAYDALRSSLAAGNMASRLYAERLAQFLDWVDRFFRDASLAGRTLFPRAFGLRTPAPLWTAPAFNRCLLLAFIYPIGMIFVIWTVSGHVGPAEAALALPPGRVGWERAVAALAICLLIALQLIPSRLAAASAAIYHAIVYFAAGIAVAFAFSDPSVMRARRFLEMRGS